MKSSSKTAVLPNQVTAGWLGWLLAMARQLLILLLNPVYIENRSFKIGDRVSQKVKDICYLFISEEEYLLLVTYEQLS